jgi:hypothetical protein
MSHTPLQDSYEYKTFLVSYRYNGAEWGIQLPARNLQDAQARLSSLAWATVDGELVMTLPASLGPLAAFAAACRNAVRRLLRPQGIAGNT